MPVETVRCLVTGATGYVGRRLVPRLLDAGYQVRALARDPDKLAAVPWRANTDVVRGDLDDLDSLVRAFDGMDVVYYLVHSMGTSGDFSAEEDRSAKNVVTAARSAGVRRLVYLGGLHPIDEQLSRHLTSRASVGTLLLDSGIETVVLQAGVVVGSGAASFELVRHLTEVLPVMTTPKWVHNKIQPIAISDALHYLVEAAAVDIPESRLWDIGGPDVLEYADMMQVYAQVAGLRRRRMLVLPLLTPALASLWVGLVTPIPSGMARPLVESLQSDAVMNDHDIDTVIAPPAGGLTPYRTAVALALNQVATAEVDAERSDVAGFNAPSESLLSDPVWAGPVVYSDDRTTSIPAGADQLWKVVESAASRDHWYSFPISWPTSRRGADRWTVEVRQPGSLLRMRTDFRVPVDAWLEVAVSPNGGTETRYRQSAKVFPRGLGGRLYWHLLRPVHALTLRRMAKAIVRGSHIRTGPVAVPGHRELSL
ncbi:DUF2867 domain-containing protein [Mycobacterium sp.]|uniref:DUF2867 domain-containing protein n=1 Tax=Mycobacterium sp. TaxID=1785 RepID=UPI003D108B06